MEVLKKTERGAQLQPKLADLDEKQKKKRFWNQQEAVTG